MLHLSTYLVFTNLAAGKIFCLCVCLCVCVCVYVCALEVAILIRLHQIFDTQVGQVKSKVEFEDGLCKSHRDPQGAPPKNYNLNTFLTTSQIFYGVVR